MKTPCDGTLKQIREIMINQFGAICIRQVELDDGGRIEFWNVNGNVIVTHAYHGDYGWTHYLPSHSRTMVGAADEIRNHINPE